jgi:hypothetical protein
MFTIGNVKVIPNVSGTFHRGTPVGVYMQIYNAGIDQTTLRPSVDVEYALMKDGKEIGKQGEDWRGTSDAGQRLTLARLINSANLAPGDYAVEVRVKGSRQRPIADPERKVQRVAIAPGFSYEFRVSSF